MIIFDLLLALTGVFVGGTTLIHNKVQSSDERIHDNAARIDSSMIAREMVVDSQTYRTLYGKIRHGSITNDVYYHIQKYMTPIFGYDFDYKFVLPQQNYKCNAKHTLQDRRKENVYMPFTEHEDNHCSSVLWATRFMLALEGKVSFDDYNFGFNLGPSYDLRKNEEMIRQLEIAYHDGGRPDVKIVRGLCTPSSYTWRLSYCS